jgi:hypothetical protein
MGIGAFLVFLAGAVLVARYLGIRDVASLIASTTRVIGLIAAVMAVGLLATGRWPAALAAGLFAASMFGWDIRTAIARAVFGAFGVKAPKRRSTWRSRRLDLFMDGETLDGRVKLGRFAGRTLASLAAAELRALLAEAAGEADARPLVEAYLDRRMPGWRENLDGDAAAREARPARPGTMTDEEAYQILGLQPGAGRAEIMEAYRRLMKAVHPDAGGSAYLAARVNAARDKLAAKHDTRSN